MPVDVPVVFGRGVEAAGTSELAGPDAGPASEDTGAPAVGADDGIAPGFDPFSAVDELGSHSSILEGFAATEATEATLLFCIFKKVAAVAAVAASGRYLLQASLKSAA